ncbi:MAG: hypothetical protein H6Q20_1752 [Bacteroidetes bacterium]|nr:hypothetical protein [Bacteroidota bacterium]
MRILIFVDSFLPPAYLPRIRYFCSYFAQKGWKVDLVTEYFVSQDRIPTEVSSLVIDYYKYRKGWKYRIEWLLKFVINLITDHKGYYFYTQSRQFTKDKQYDFVFCSTYFTFPLTTAAKAARKLQIPLFVDLRDIVEQFPDDNPFITHKLPGFAGKIIAALYKKISVLRRNKVLKTAAAVTTVSPWHVDALLAYNPNTHLLYNGYDEQVFIPEKLSADKFVVSYYGRLYTEKVRNPRLLFQAISRLQNKGILTPENTVLQWFIDKQSSDVISAMTDEYGLKDFTVYRDFVTQNILTDEINKSSVVLVLCNHDPGKQYSGIMTTKVFEAIGLNRPVLCVPDNKDNLADLIRETNCGIVSSDVDEVENFLLTKFTEWQQLGHTQGMLSDTVRLKYSRKNGAEILENLILNTIAL